MAMMAISVQVAQESRGHPSRAAHGKIASEGDQRLQQPGHHAPEIRALAERLR
jgi:hypothetical protein